MGARKNKKRFNAKAGSDSPPLTISPAFSFDADEFIQFLDETDWSDDQKREYLSLVWSIVCEFVALGFNVHPIQQAQKDCGKPQFSAVQPSSGTSEMVDSSHGELIEKFISLNGPVAALGEEGVADE